MADIYEITIKKISTVTKTKKGEWSIVDKRPYTDAELAEANKTFREAYSGKPDAFGLKEVRDYAPDVESEDEITTEIYRQRQEALDLKVVIAAINGLKGA